MFHDENAVQGPGLSNENALPAQGPTNENTTEASGSSSSDATIAGPSDEILQMFLPQDSPGSLQESNFYKSSQQEMYENACHEMSAAFSSGSHGTTKDNDKPDLNLFSNEKPGEYEHLFETRKVNADSEAQNYDKQSRRSLRLKAGKKSTPYFSYKLLSDEEDLAITGNDQLNEGALESQYTSAKKSKSTWGVFPCDKCRVTCKTAFNLKQHRQTHDVSTYYTCSQCDYRCRRRSDLKKHKETHAASNLYSCLECDYSGKRLKYLKKHMRTHSKTLLFSCHLCEFRPRNKISLVRHLLEHSEQKSPADLNNGEKPKKAAPRKKMAPSEDRLFPCSVCGAAFKRKYHLKRHAVRHGLILESKDIIIKSAKNKDEDVLSSESKKVGESKHDDDEDAGTGSEAQDGADMNLKTENSKKKYEMSENNLAAYRLMRRRGMSAKCPVCNYTCTNKTFLQRHLRRHRDHKPFICSQCGSAFRRKDHLEVHKFTHNDQRPFKCPHCLYGTHRKYRLKLHILTHQTIKPIKCSLCIYSCRRDCELRYHMRNKHGKELELEPQAKSTSAAPEIIELKCEMCDYTCDSHKRMKYHMERHENKTPHSCPHCDYKCSSRSSMSDHLLRHAGIKPCLCSVCGMAFRNTSRLNRHKLVHSDVKPYGCNFCEFSSRSRYNLKQHILRHTDQERTRRRNRKPLKSKMTFSNNTTEILKQSYQTDIHTLLSHLGTDLHLDNVPSSQVGSQMLQDSKSSLKFTEAFQTDPISQFIDRVHAGAASGHYKPKDRSFEQNDNSSYNTGYQNPDITMHPYNFERSAGLGTMNPVSSYSDSYQTSDPYMSHQNPMSYNPHMSIGAPNPNYYYMDRNSGGYGFSSPYLYSETVFPGNMSYYNMCQRNANAYSMNSNETLAMNQSLSHTSPSTSQIHAPTSALPPVALLPTSDIKKEAVAEPTNINTGSSALKNEDTSTDIPLDQGSDDSYDDDDDDDDHDDDDDDEIKQTNKTDATPDDDVIKNDVNEKSMKSTLVCSECGYICLTNTMLQRHKMTHVDLKPHPCDECGMTFKRMDHMKAHRRTHLEEKPFSCKQCSYTCSRKYRLKIHEMIHTNEQPYPCDICETIFHTEEELKEHAQIHTTGFMFSCDKCDFKCKEKAELRTHTETHKTFMCKKCSYVCRSSREFSSHLRMHSEKEELVCSVCGYTCDSQKRLKYHMERHENKTPHSCPHCDYKCSSRSSLTDHLLQHEGLKPFLCSSCGMRFRNISRLNRHKMTHTDVKPHSCEYCPFSSRSRYNLKKHLLRHFK